MLTELHLENFKAWRELTIEFGRITALFGENSAGKSSLMHFLLMLKQTKNAADRVWSWTSVVGRRSWSTWAATGRPSIGGVRARHFRTCGGI